MFPDNFSLAVAGDGKMMAPLVEKLKIRFPGIIIYDRNEEARRDDSDVLHPSIPQVAYVDVLFSRDGDKELATIRCFHRHRLFNYDMQETPAGSKSEAFLLNSMLTAVDNLCELPKINTPPVAEPPEDSDVSDEPENVTDDETDTTSKLEPS